MKNCYLIIFILYSLISTPTLVSGMEEFQEDLMMIELIPPDSTLSQSDLNFALLNAAFKNNLDSVMYYVQEGANVDTMTFEGATPLIYACQNRNLEMLEFLIRNNAKLNLKDGMGFTPLMLAAELDYFYVADMLIYYEADLNKTDLQARSALMIAIENTSYSTAELLIESGAQLDLRDSKGQTALMKASKNGETKMVELLINSGATINAADKNSYTALGHAIKRGHPETTERLIELGANPHEMLSPEINLMDIARINGHRDIVNLLESKEVVKNKRLLISHLVFDMGTHFNAKDAMIGFAGGVHELRTNTEALFGADARLWAKSVRIKESDKEYYQYWEYRYNVFLKLSKQFKLYGESAAEDVGFRVFVKPSYTFGSYRGVKENPNGTFKLRPGGGFYFNYMYFGGSLEYEYVDYRLSNMGPHRININLRIQVPLNKHLQ